MDKLNDNITKLIEARRALSKASVGVPDPDTIQRQKELLAHYNSELSDYIGVMEQEIGAKKNKTFNDALNAGDSVDKATKLASGKHRAEDAALSKLKRLNSDAHDRLINAQSLLKDYNSQRIQGSNSL